MNSTKRKKHWENIFSTKDTTKVSWYQPSPETSLEIISELNPAKNAKIIEVGCGDSFIADFLLDEGFCDISLLDISEKAIDIVKNRLFDFNEKLHFVATDITEFKTGEKFTIWHDRAVFHFLIDDSDIAKYLDKVSNYIEKDGYLIISTFSENGPEMCSGLQVRQYNEDQITLVFNSSFNKIRCFTQNHKTPSGGMQNFICCIFQRK